MATAIGEWRRVERIAYPARLGAFWTVSPSMIVTRESLKD